MDKISLATKDSKGAMYKATYREKKSGKEHTLRGWSYLLNHPKYGKIIVTENAYIIMHNDGEDWELLDFGEEFIEKGS